MTEVFFNGPAGRIEGKYHESKNKRARGVLILHPHHPVYGGTMDNKVVHELSKRFIAQDFNVLRINFRGVNKSQGQFDNGVGELMDAATSLDWMQTTNELTDDYWIAGFSFGAWIAMQLMMRRPEISNFFAISPPINKYDFGFLSPCPVPGCVIQGDQDSIVPEESVMQFVERLSKQRKSELTYSVVSGADHFFREKLDELGEIVTSYIKLSTTQKGKKSTEHKRHVAQRDKNIFLE